MYRENYLDFTEWLSESKGRLDHVSHMPADKAGLADKHAQVQLMLVDKDTGQGKLNTAIDSGEKLYPDTATSGREKIRKQLRTAKDVWDRLLTDLMELQKNCQTSVTQWASFTDGQQHLDKWMLEVDTWLKTDTEPKTNLQEKRTQLQNNKVNMALNIMIEIYKL